MTVSCKMIISNQHDCVWPKLSGGGVFATPTLIDNWIFESPSRDHANRDVLAEAAPTPPQALGQPDSILFFSFLLLLPSIVLPPHRPNLIECAEFVHIQL